MAHQEGSDEPSRRSDIRMRGGDRSGGRQEIRSISGIPYSSSLELLTREHQERYRSPVLNRIGSFGLLQDRVRRERQRRGVHHAAVGAAA